MGDDGLTLITGPTGNVGSELVDLFVDRPIAAPWRVVSRHPELMRPRLLDSGAEVGELDFFDRSTWPAALDGVTTLFLLFPRPGNRAAREAIIPFVEAAVTRGCRHVVFISVLGADRARILPHCKVEAALQQHVPSWTVLQCGFFMQNLHRAVSTHGIDITESGELFVPAGRGSTTFLDAGDAAAVAAVVLADPAAHRNLVYQLTGAQRLTMTEVAAALNIELGYPVRYSNPGVMRFASRLQARGVGWDTIGFMSAVYTLTRFGANQQITEDLPRLLGRPARTVEEFLRSSAWRWHDRAWT